MSQCVPSWDLDNSAPQKPYYVHAHSNSANSLPFHVPSLDYEQVAELTWENGQLAMHGLARVGTTKPSATAAVPSSIKYAAAWDKPRAGGTLESIVNQATTHKPAAAGEKHPASELVPWFDHHRAAAAVDALVPCSNNNNNNKNNAQYYKNNENQESSAHVPRCSALVGSCSGAGSALDGGGVACKCGGASESASRQVTVDNNSEREFGGGGPTSTSLWSPENTSSGGEYTRTSAEEHDSVCHARSQRDDRKKKATGKSSASTKSRAAAIHNQSERKRRDKINQRMKTLQKMVPNSSKTDKASMLDEVIEYLKQLQAQVHMMSRMNMPSMMMPLAMQQHQLQMSMMTSMGMGVMDMGRMPPTGAFVPMAPPSWDIQCGVNHSLPPDLLSAFLTCQSQPNPMTMDAYSRVAALYQQFQQPPASGPKN